MPTDTTTGDTSGTSALPPAYCPLRHLDEPADLERYLDLRAERDRIDEALAALSPTILAALEAEDDGQTEARGYVLSAKVRRSYVYSDDVREAETYVRECKAAERASGSATVGTVTGYVEARRSTPTDADEALAVATVAVAAARAA